VVLVGGGELITNGGDGGDGDGDGGGDVT
jgi:hypothetical protein